VEKASENLEERLNLRRLVVSSEQGLESKLFVQLVTLILLSHITIHMQESNFSKDYTLQEIFEELDAFECFELPGQTLMVGEKTQRRWTSMRNWGL